MLEISYSSRLDGGSWTDWSQYGTWLRNDIADGTHLLEARTRDPEGNIDTGGANGERRAFRTRRG